jgi:cellulose biosynthesis protein BcsQ
MSDYTLFQPPNKGNSNRSGDRGNSSESILNYLKHTSPVSENIIAGEQSLKVPNVELNSFGSNIQQGNCADIHIFTSNSGSIGTSSLAVLYSQYLVKLNKKVLFIDMGELKYGIDLLLGKEKTDAVRFDSLLNSKGDLIITKFLSNLIGYEGVKVLSINHLNPFLPETDIIESLINQIKYEFDDIIIDCPPNNLFPSLLEKSTTIVILVPDDVYGVANNSILINALTDYNLQVLKCKPKTKQVVRSLTDKEIFDYISKPILGEYKFTKKIKGLIDVGLGPKLEDKSKILELCKILSTGVEKV